MPRVLALTILLLLLTTIAGCLGAPAAQLDGADAPVAAPVEVRMELDGRHGAFVTGCASGMCPVVQSSMTAGRKLDFDGAFAGGTFTMTWDAASERQREMHLYVTRHVGETETIVAEVVGPSPLVLEVGPIDFPQGAHLDVYGMPVLREDALPAVYPEQAFRIEGVLRVLRAEATAPA